MQIDAPMDATHTSCVIDIRTVLAGLIALALALTPLASEAAFTDASSGVLTKSEGNIPRCSCCHDQKHSKTPADCILKCLSHFSALIPTQAAGWFGQYFAADAPCSIGKLHGRLQSPPTPPPQA